MGRPIKKKFFGNLNREYYGSVNRGSGVGGEGVASVVMITTATTGYTTLPTVTFPAVTYAGGAVATGAARMQLKSVSITSNANGGTGYAVGDILTFAGGSGTAATVRVATISGSSTVTSVALISLGDYTALPNGGTTATHTASTGSGLVLNATYAVKSITVTDSGSGYENTGTVTISGSGGAAGRTVLYAGTTRQDAITIISYLTTGSSAISGGDIIKQESSRRYLVKNAQGQGICRLNTGTLAAGGMHIIATDYKGSTYWVTKLTANKARLYNRTNTSTAVFSVGQVAKWTLSNTSTFTGAATLTNVSISHTL
jgi:hypothetical protein